MSAESFEAAGKSRTDATVLGLRTVRQAGTLGFFIRYACSTFQGDPKSTGIGLKEIGSRSRARSRSRNNGGKLTDDRRVLADEGQEPIPRKTLIMHDQFN